MLLRKIAVVFTAFLIALGCIVQNGMAFQQTSSTEQDDDPAWVDPPDWRNG